MITDKDVPARIRELMEERDHMTSYELSAKSGVASSTTYKIVNGESIPQIDSLQRICDGLGITMKQLFSDKDEMETAGRSDVAKNATEKELLELARTLSPAEVRELIAFFMGAKMGKKEQ